MIDLVRYTERRRITNKLMKSLAKQFLEPNAEKPKIVWISVTDGDATDSSESKKEDGGKGVFLKCNETTPFFRGFFNLIFYSNEGILVILHPKTMSFWVFRPFSQFHLI
jgi:hypothetical protein